MSNPSPTPAREHFPPGYWYERKSWGFVLHPNGSTHETLAQAKAWAWARYLRVTG